MLKKYMGNCSFKRGDLVELQQISLPEESCLGIFIETRASEGCPDWGVFFINNEIISLFMFDYKFKVL
jgi:hypothetical protein